MLIRRGFGSTAQALRESSAIPFTSSMAVKLVQNGKKIFQKIFARQRIKVPESKVPQIQQQRNPALIGKNANILEYRNGSLFNQFVYRSYIKSLASEIRRRAALQFQRNGRQLPIFAFVGLAVAQNKKDSECEVSSNIREIFSKDSSASSILDEVRHLTLDAFDFGGIIGKGCNSVVYEARLKSNVVPDPQPVDSIVEETEIDSDSDITILSTSESGETTEDFDLINDTLNGDEEASITDEEVIEDDFVRIMEDEINYLEDHLEETEDNTSEGPTETNDFDLGIKMMFNYDVESRAESIYRAMQKESVPARFPLLQDDTDDWQNGNRVRLKSLPPHPNIVDMLGVFVAPVPTLDNAREVYPAALPKRINEDGFGRNMTMFVVMKKYPTTLRQYLAESKPDMYTRCLMLGQLLEGILHLQKHGIAHRDLKSDNILVNGSGPQVEVVICDFGCCLAEKNLGLQVPYVTADTDKGGNSALMAPEIATAEPGANVILDFTKSDLWAVGTLVYELFGMNNPFYRDVGSEHRLDSRTYRDSDLPCLPDAVPEPIKKLTYWILKTDPKERPSPLEAATIFQLYMTFPGWLEPGRMPRFTEMAESLLLFGAEAVLRGWPNKRKEMTAEDTLKLTFLRRFDLREAYNGLKNYHNAIRPLMI